MRGPLWILLCVLGLLAAAWLMRRRQETREDFFLGGRRLPAWAVCLSLIAAEIGALTIVGIPAVAYRENWHYLQYYLGASAARVAITFLLLPALMRSDSLTLYDFFQKRLGKGARSVSAGLFFATRLLGSSARLMAAGAALGVLLGWRLRLTIPLIAGVAAAVVGLGGLRAAVWAGVLQAGVLFLAAAAVTDFLLVSIEGGLGEAVHVAGTAGRFDLWMPGAAWIAVLHGMFGTAAAVGGDHEYMQRLMSVRSLRAGQRALLWTIAGSLVLLVFLLAIGSGMFVYYEQHPEMALPADLDGIYTHFSVQIMGPGLRGLLAAAVFMAAVDLPLASLSAVFVLDVYRARFRPAAPEGHYVRAGRVSAVAFAALLAMGAYFFSSRPGLLWTAFKVGGVTFGPLLGLMITALTTRRGAGGVAGVAASISALACGLLLVLNESGRLRFDWSWLVVFGAFGTIALAALFERLKVKFERLKGKFKRRIALRRNYRWR